MTPPLPATLAIRLEKAAADNGFDVPREAEEGWLAFGSTLAPLRVWLRRFGDAVTLVALSDESVARALGEHGTPMTAPLPEGAAAGRTVPDVPALHRLLARAIQLSRALPNELLHSFESATAELPRSTEAERLVVERVGQDVFRGGLIAYWEGHCAMTGFGVVELLRASHIKPWADCERDAERLDVHNGLLLAPHLDAAFDQGFITVEDDGAVTVSERLGAEDRALLGLDGPLRVRGLAEGHRRYLPWHRERVFEGWRTSGSE